MRVTLAYIFIVLLWATTPLAIKWSADGSSFIFGVTARMSIGLICTLILLLLSRTGLVWHSQQSVLILLLLYKFMRQYLVFIGQHNLFLQAGFRLFLV